MDNNTDLENKDYIELFQKTMSTGKDMINIELEKKYNTAYLQAQANLIDKEKTLQEKDLLETQQKLESAQIELSKLEALKQGIQEKEQRIQELNQYAEDLTETLRSR